MKIAVGYLMALPASFRRRSLELEKIQTQAELSSIKSIQLELVRSSKLERNIIKLDKELEKIKGGHDALGARLKSVVRIVRVYCFSKCPFIFSNVLVFAI